MALSDTLLENGLTFVGTVRNNKRFLPDQFKQKTGQGLHSSSFVFKLHVRRYFQSLPLSHVLFFFKVHHWHTSSLTHCMHPCVCVKKKKKKKERKRERESTLLLMSCERTTARVHMRWRERGGLNDLHTVEERERERERERVFFNNVSMIWCHTVTFLCAV